MKKNLLEAGKIINTHGVRGEVRIQPWADSPGFLAGFGSLYIDGKPFEVLSARVHKGFVIVAFEEASDIDAAIKLKNKVVFIDKDSVKLEAGQHFIADIFGLCAIDEKTGEELGTIADVMTLPANNVYVIEGKRTILVPAVEEFIVETNIEAGYVKVRLIEGM